MISEHGVIVNLPVGTVAAILTTCEFILSTITALAARAAIRGMWLLTLHKGGKAPVSAAARARRAFLRDALSFIIGLFLVISVALVEAGLHTTYIVQRQPIFENEDCVRLDRPMNPEYLEFLIPSIQTGIEPWIETVVEDIGCNTSSLITVGSGGVIDIHRGHREFYAPVCGDDNMVPLKDANVLFETLKVKPNCLDLMPGHTDMVEIFFHSKDMIIEIPMHLHDGDVEEVDIATASQVCTNKNLSSVPTSVQPTWMSTFTTAQSLSTSVINEICSLHNQEDQIVLTAYDVLECSYIPHMRLSADCLRNIGLSKSAIHTVQLSDVSALFVKKKREDPAFVCLNSVLEIEYVVVSGDTMSIFRNHLPSGHPIIVPTKVSAVSGHCEKTIHVSGRAALIYNIESDWKSSYWKTVDRISRYHALMIAVSDSQFPLSHLDRKPTDEKKPCALRPVSQAAEFPHDARLTVLYIAVFVAATLMILGLLLRLWFRGRSWMVGSANWSLQQFAGENYWDDTMEIGRETEFEVIVAEQSDGQTADDNNDQTSPVEQVDQTTHRHEAGQRVSAVLPVGANRYTYHLRRVCRKSSKMVEDV